MYDYSGIVYSIVRVAGALILLAAVLLVSWIVHKERRKKLPRLV